MRKLLTSCIFVVFCFLTVVIMAQVPQLLNYQGRLTDDKGIPIITPTTVKFSLYQGGDAATPGSGTPVYEEDATVTPDGNGVFSHLIGSGTVIYGTLDATVFQIKIPVYLEITVDPAGANETLLPRKQIVTVGYSFISELAYDADKVDGEHAAAFSPMGHNHDTDYVDEGQADSITSAMIVDGTIVDADINASANIAASKIDPTGLDADLLDGKDSLDFVHTTGDDMTGKLMVETSTIFSLYGRSSDTSGRGVTGFASSTSGTTFGVYGASASTSGYGVYGTAPTNGVYGEATATSGLYTYGVYGKSDSTLYASFSAGVYGEATATSGYSYGVQGKCRSPEGSAVYGYNTADTGSGMGVYGKSDSIIGKGVYGIATAATGEAAGVYGISHSINGRGVYGYASVGGGTNYGVHGQTTSPDGFGVFGQNINGIGVCGYAYGTNGTNYGVYGKTDSPDGYAGYFEGNARVTGNLTVDGTITAQGVKPCVQPIDNGKKVLLYAMESPEIWFEDFGAAQLVNGQAVVQLESVFTQAANTEIAYFVFPIPNGDCNGLYIASQDKDSFEVRELGDGTSNISFYYRIVAKRRGYEEVRFEEFNEPEQPPTEPNIPAERK